MGGGRRGAVRTELRSAVCTHNMTYFVFCRVRTRQRRRMMLDGPRAEAPRSRSLRVRLRRLRPRGGSGCGLGSVRAPAMDIASFGASLVVGTLKLRPDFFINRRRDTGRAPLQERTIRQRSAFELGFAHVARTGAFAYFRRDDTRANVDRFAPPAGAVARRPC